MLSQTNVYGRPRQTIPKDPSCWLELETGTNNIETVRQEPEGGKLELGSSDHRSPRALSNAAAVSVLIACIHNCAVVNYDGWIAVFRTSSRRGHGAARSRNWSRRPGKNWSLDEANCIYLLYKPCGLKPGRIKTQGSFTSALDLGLFQISGKI